MAKEGEEHFVGKIAQKVIIEKNGKILLIRDPRSSINAWEFPGGRLNMGEMPIDGAIREVKEELGIDVEIMQPIYTETFVHPKDGDHLSVFYWATLIDPRQELVLQEKEVSFAEWMDREQILNETLYEDHRRALDVFFKIREK